MCNSISITAEAADLVKQFQIDNVLLYTSNRHEIHPTDFVSAIVVRDHRRQLDEFRWGLMPFWAKDSIWMDSPRFLEKRAFARILKKQRCVIPCSGFYISQTDGKRTDWIRFAMRSGTFGIAGLYDVWRSPTLGEEMHTCTMMMTAANSLVLPYHHRMPVILDADGVDTWLQPETKDPFVLTKLLRPMDERHMAASRLSSPEDKLESDSGIEISLPEIV